MAAWLLLFISGVCIQSGCFLAYVLVGGMPNPTLPKYVVVGCYVVCTAGLFHVAAARFTFSQLLFTSLLLACAFVVFYEMLGRIWFGGLCKDIDLVSLRNLVGVVTMTGFAFVWFAVVSTISHMWRGQIGMRSAN